MEYLRWLLKEHPELGGAIVCLLAILSAFAYGTKKGWVALSRPGRRQLIPKPNQPKNESGRHRAVQMLDVVEEEELELPANWDQHVRDTVVHKFNNLTQEHIYPLIQQNKARLDRLEPIVAELKTESQETHDSVVRQEVVLEGVKTAIKDMRDEVMVALDRRRNER